MLVPPFAGVTLVEYRDHIELTPVYWYREIVGLGRYKASEVGPQPGDDLHPFFNAVMGDKEIWGVVSWRRFEDGTEEPINFQYLDPEATEEEARSAYVDAVRFLELGKAELEEIGKCFVQTEEDLAYIENRFPDAKIGPPDSKSVEESDVYQARLKVMAGIQPKTVKLILDAGEEDDPKRRDELEKKAVQAYFAEMAHLWTEDLVREWQRTNPLGTEWMCEFARVWREPERRIDPINHELALNWLKRKYNLLTAEELSDAILIVTGQRMMPETIKKRRERLGLTTKRPPGPKLNSER
jgi:hypothetical protein